MREKLIEILLGWGGLTNCAEDMADYLIANGVRLEEKQATSDKTSEENKRWIPVTERLPLDYKERVLVKIRDFADVIGHPSVDTDRYICGGGWVRWNGHVTHWMPLPEPPKGE